jgi:hypothetical protein
MPSSYSPSIRLELPANGEQVGTWGQTVDVDLNLIDQAVAGVLSIAMADADLTLTALNGASDQSRNAYVILTGALTATRNIIVPSVTKLYTVKNSTNRSIVVKTSAGTGITLPINASTLLVCDGTNVLDAVGYFSNLGVGQAVTTAVTGAIPRLQVQANTSTSTEFVGADGTFNLHSMTSYGSTAGNILAGFTFRGTKAAPTVSLAGDVAMSVQGRAYDGAASRLVSRMAVVVDTVTGSNDISSYLTFDTRPDGFGAVPLERARITKNGNVLIGGTTDLNEKLQVTGRAFLANQTAPSTPTGGGVIYVESGALKYKGSSGTVTVLGAA